MLQKQTCSSGSGGSSSLKAHTMQWSCTRGLDPLHVHVLMDAVCSSYETEQDVLSRFGLVKKIGSPSV